MTVWWLAIDRNGGHCSYDELKKRRVVAQGWPDFGDLSKKMEFRYQMNKSEVYDVIQRIGDAAYHGQDFWKKDRQLNGTPRIFWNLLNLRAGDLIVGIEGTQVRGICELALHGIDGYTYNPSSNYAHGFGGAVEWEDWKVSIFGSPPTAPRLSVKGIARLSNQESSVVIAWNTYRRSVGS